LSCVNKLESFLVDEYVTIKIACHFVGVDGKGELEDVLRGMKKLDSHHADCLDSWNCCLNNKGLDKKTDKEINKLWVHYYLKYDAFISYSNSTKPEDKYCKVENIFLNLKDITDKEKGKVFEENISSELFDFEKEGFTELQQLKDFLKLFKSESVE
jgi:hypothetical protein